MRARRTATMALAIALTLLTTAALAATTVRVAGDTAAAENDPGWMFNRDASTATPFTFDVGAASLGDGALHVLPIGATPADKMIAELFTGGALQVADLDSLTYDFLIGPGGTAADANEFYLNVYANFGSSDPLKFYDCRYDVVPTTGSTAAFTTVTFDPTASYPVTTRGSSPFTCPASPAGMDALDGPAVIRAFAMNVGDTSAGDVGLDGFLDAVVVTVDGDATTYDFEPDPDDKDDCKGGGWEAYGFRNQGQCIRFVNTGQDSR